jgi:hypothetical protein
MFRVLLLTLAGMLHAFLLYYSEWWEVVSTGDRCLYPDSFHLFVDSVCVGKLETGSRHGALCLPILSEEMYRLPPTEDANLLHYNLLDNCLLLLGLTPIVLAALSVSSPAVVSKDSDGRNCKLGIDSYTSLIYVVRGLLSLTAAGSVLTAPTASAPRWAEGLATCDVVVRPGSALIIALITIPLDLYFAARNSALYGATLQPIKGTRSVRAPLRLDS